MSDNPGRTVLKYREQLDKLEIKWTPDMDQAALKALLEKAMKGASQQADDELHNESATAAAEQETAVFVDGRIAALEKQIAEMKAMLSNTSSTNPSLTPELVAALIRGGKNEVTDGLVDPSFIKPEDELEEAKTYYRYGPTHNIFNGWKGGVMVKLPYEMKFIKFEKSTGWTVRSGSGVQNRIVSVFITKNRKVAEFLESYHEFGKTIHLDRQKAFDTSVTGRYMDLYNKHFQSLQREPIHTLARMAKDLGIEGSMSWSHQEYSDKIAESRALAAMNDEKASFENSMRALDIDKNLLQNA